MPELPEVETIKNDLEKKLPDKKIREVEIRKERMVRDIGSRELADSLEGVGIIGMDRKGKLIFFELNNSLYLVIHLKMTGQLIYVDKQGMIAGGHSPEEERSVMEAVGGDPPNKYTHIIFKFQDGSHLYFNDLRQFGYIKLAGKEELEKIKRERGVDPLSEDFNSETAKEIFKNRKVAVKKVLMDQKVIAGIGNIYADEILFEAGIRPDRQAKELKEKEITSIVKASKKILKKAIQYRGTTFSNYTDCQGKKGNFVSRLKVYGRKEGEKCYRCGGKIKVAKINNRSTRYCPKCQK